MTLFDKIWDRHIVKKVSEDTVVLYIDRQFIHEVTSPQAFTGLRNRSIPVAHPEQVTATADHNVPTLFQDKPIADQESATAVRTLEENCAAFGIKYYGLGDPKQGIVHIIGPEQGLTQPGMTIICGDSHTATHGAFGTIAFGVGTSEVEMALASQCILQTKPRQMRITIDGQLGKHVYPKDVILYIISQLTSAGGTGYFVEYAGEVFRNMSMEGRMTVCNMTIEMGARGGLIAPDNTTLEYLQQRVPHQEYQQKLSYWQSLYTEDTTHFDKEYRFTAEDIQPMITYGTNPGMAIPVDGIIPSDEPNKKALEYMGFRAGESLLGKPIDYVFIGSCTNGRLEDFRVAASIIKGHKKSDRVTAYLVPGSKLVEDQCHQEGLTAIFEEAGFTFRQPGCSACLAMNEDKVPSGKYCISTSNRNFEGRQGIGSRTLLASPALAAMAAITGKISQL